MTRRALLTDALCVVLTFSIGTFVAREYLATRTVGYPFFDWELGPAVMLACGNGFSQPQTPVPALAAFVERQADSFDCQAVSGHEVEPPVQIANVERYALYAVAWALELGGVSWRALDWYLATLFGVSTALTYAIFRIVSGPALAIAGSLFLACSTRLDGLLLYRDYVKEPPFLALLLVVAWLAVREQTRWSAWIASGLAGVLLGIGIGWRMDLFVFLPFVLLTIAALVRWATGEGRLAVRAIAALVFLVGFAAAGSPIIRTMSQGSNSAHVVLLGLTSLFTTRLGLTPPPYDIGEHYSDGYAFTLIAAQARVRERMNGPFPFGKRVYDEVGTRLVTDFVRHFPADALARAYGAVQQALAYPFSRAAIQASRQMEVFSRNALLNMLAAIRWIAASALGGLGLYLTIAAILAVAASDVRLAAFAVIAVTYFCGYSMLQFSRRHTFHLDVFAAASALFLLQAVISAASRAIGRTGAPGRDARGSRRLSRAVVFAGVVAAALVVPLVAARAYQQRHVPRLIDDPLQRARPIPMASADRDGQAVLLSSPALGEHSSPGPEGDTRDVRMDYLVATLDPKPCAAGPVSVELRYTGVVHTSDREFNRTFTIDLRDGPHRLLAPVFFEYGSLWTHFDGLVVHRAQAACVTSLARVDQPGDLPFPFIYAALGQGWRQEPLYQRFTWEAGRP